MAPWAVLGGFGAVRMWQWFGEWPKLLRHPAWSLAVLGLTGDVALFLFRSRIPGPAWVPPALLVAWPIFAFGFCWSLGKHSGRVAFGGVIAHLFTFYCLLYSYQSLYLDDYQEDQLFLKEARQTIDATRPMFINDDRYHPLETAWLLFYSDDSAVLVDDVKSLIQKHARDGEVFLVARMRDEKELMKLASCEVVLQSKHTRGERSFGDRRTLFRLRLSDALTKR
jgi:hypothetical protein